MILVSKCLLGVNCKYNGGNNLDKKVMEYLEGKEYVSYCPECAMGLPIPRVPSEISQIDGRVYSKDGNDLTDKFVHGADKTLEFAKVNNVDLAILKQSSPSCGNGKIYDGTFSGTKIKGDGFTAKLLKENNIKVISEEDI